MLLSSSNKAPSFFSADLALCKAERQGRSRGLAPGFASREDRSCSKVLAVFMLRQCWQSRSGRGSECTKRSMRTCEPRAT